MRKAKYLYDTSLRLGLGVGLSGGSGSGVTDTEVYLPTVAASPSAAWGFRRLVSGYTGNLFRLVRTSDSATLDIAQTGVGEPDLSGYAAWVGASSSRIDIVYDQVGSNNLTQTTSANRPHFFVADVFRGAYGATMDGASSHYFNIPAGLTGDGMATTTLDIVHPTSSNSGTGYSQLGATYNGAGSRALQLGSTTNPKIYALNSAFRQSAAIARAQPQVVIAAYGASVDTMRSNGAGGTVTAGTAGTWAGGFIGRISVPYGFGGQFFGRVIYPATLGSTDISSLETACSSMYPIDLTPGFRLVMPGNSIVQGTGAVRSLHNNPRQADAYFSQRADVIDAGVFGQTAATQYTNRAQYSTLYSGAVRSLIQCPEPTNDIDANFGANSLGAVAVTLTGDRSSGTKTILNCSTTTGLSIGQYFTGSGIPAGTTITNIVSTTVTLSANATTTATGATFVAKVAITANRTSGSNVLSSVNNFTGIATGQILSGTGIPAQTTISSFDSGAGTITMSANASSSGTGGTVIVIDNTLVASNAATLWSGASGVRAFFSAMVTAGFSAADCLIPTTLPRNWAAGEGNSRFDQKEAVRRAYNALIASDQATYGYTVIDYAGISALSNYAGANYGDGVHPNSTNFASGLEVSGNGYGYMAKLLSDTVNAIL